MLRISVLDLVSLVKGSLLAGESTVEISGFTSLREVVHGNLSFFHDSRYEALLRTTRASAVLVPATWTAFPAGVVCIGVANPSAVFEWIVETYGVQPQPFTAGVHSSAVIAASARVDPAVTFVGANAVIEEGAILEAGVEVGPGSYVGRNAVIGMDSKLAANCTVLAGCILGQRVLLHPGVVIGSDGFGYEFEQGRHRKVRQAGIVQIDNDVEIGAGTTIDRARFGRTWIGEGTKIDNLVQIAHNVVIGRHCLIVACSAIAGSATIGDFVVIAAQVGVTGHVRVESGSTLGGRAGVTKNLRRGSYLGFPAIDAAEERRRIATVNRLPKLLDRVKVLEARLETMERLGGNYANATDAEAGLPLPA